MIEHGLTNYKVNIIIERTNFRNNSSQQIHPFPVDESTYDDNRHCNKEGKGVYDHVINECDRVQHLINFQEFHLKAKRLFN